MYKFQNHTSRIKYHAQIEFPLDKMKLQNRKSDITRSKGSWIENSLMIN